MNILIVVTHLLGTGHLARALSLGRSFSRSGHDVHVVSGGMPVEHLSSEGVILHQLPPLRSDGTDFARLLDGGGSPASETYLADRREMLQGLIHKLRPDIVVTELFPFGRRNLRVEFEHLLEAAHALTPRPVLLSSIRDILAPPSKPAKVRLAHDILHSFYDGVLVHSDPRLVSLEDSWPNVAEIADMLHYTGYVADPLPAADPQLETNEVLVSAGGGQVGASLFAAANDVAWRTPHMRWRFLVPPGSIAEEFDWPENAICTAPDPAFRARLRGAAASVSFCGYNTALDVLQAGIPAIFTPFDDGGEVEQSQRARALARLPGIRTLGSFELRGDTLETALLEVMSEGRSRRHDIDMDGAARSVAIAEDLFRSVRR